MTLFSFPKVFAAQANVQGSLRAVTSFTLPHLYPDSTQSRTPLQEYWRGHSEGVLLGAGAFSGLEEGKSPCFGRKCSLRLSLSFQLLLVLSSLSFVFFQDAGWTGLSPYPGEAWRWGNKAQTALWFNKSPVLLLFVVSVVRPQGQILSVGFEKGAMKTYFQIWPQARKGKRNPPDSLTVYEVQKDQEVSQEWGPSYTGMSNVYSPGIWLLCTDLLGRLEGWAAGHFSFHQKKSQTTRFSIKIE